MHIPDDPLYYEKFYFTPGDLGFRAIDTSAGRLGTLVAGISGIPKARVLLRLQGATCFFIPRRSAGIPPRKPSWRGAARCLAHDSARPRHRQRSVCRGRESRGI